SLGFRPSVTLSGPLNTAVPDQVRSHLLAVLREALSNVARHSRAGSAAVSVAVDNPADRAGDPAVVLMVEDDGRGIAGATPGNGLPNMLARADALGGTCAVSPAERGGTRLIWRVPLH
ncbi:MAG TPA: ATP-binding protein, partial [Nakamurella sp.]